MSGVPPPASERRPAATAARVHRMRVARGACWLLVAALGAAAGLILLDAAARLPGWARGLGLAVWLTATGVLAWRLVVLPWNADAPDEPGRSAREELPGNLRAAAAAAVSLAAALLAAALVPGAVEHVRRTALPWNRPAASTKYRVVVTSGEPVVRRGDPVTLSAYAEKTDPADALPAEAFLVVRDRPGGPERKLPMTGDGGGAFHAAVPGVAADFEYRVEIGAAASDWLSVAALDPADLAPQSAVEVSPPKYAATRQPKPPVPGLGPLDGFQHGAAIFRLRFTRPAAAVLLDFRADGAPTPEPIPVALADDRLSGTATLRLRQSGIVRLVTVAEQNGKKLRTEVAAAVRVTPDAPPWFESLSGVSPRPLAVRPGEPLPVRFTARDETAVGGAVLEYVLDRFDSKSVSLTIPLAGAGTPRAHGTFDLDVSKLAAGETLRFRVRVRDTCRLDDPEYGPQEAAYPATGWASVRVDAAAPPLDQQEVLGRRDSLRAALVAAAEEVKAAAAEAHQLRADTADKPDLAIDQTVRLGDARDRARKAADLLRAAAAEVALNPEVRPLAVPVRLVADTHLKDAEDSLRKAGTDPPAARAAALAAAVKALNAASSRVEAAAERGDRHARNLLDFKHVAALRDDQRSLVELVPTNAPAAELAKAQRELLARFRSLLAESAPLRAAADAARAAEFRGLAARATDLAANVARLDAAVKQLHADARKSLADAVAAELGALAEDVTALAVRVETPVRLASTARPKPEDVRRAAERFAEGKGIEAQAELLKLAMELDAVAATFDTWAAERTDPKAAARQLATWQDDLRARFRAATAGNAANFAALPVATRDAFRAEQAALLAAARALRPPPGDDLKAARDSALMHLAAADGFLTGTGANAEVAMTAAFDHLTRLTGRIPTAPERLAKTRGEFERLRHEQELIATAAELALRGADPAAPAVAAKKLDPVAARQAKQLAPAAALDLPGLEARKARAVAALSAAVADMKDGSPLDAAASLAWARREFDRLKLALDGTPPPDDRAEELAARLEAITKAVADLGPTPTAAQLAPHGAAAQDTFRQFDKLPTLPEAPGLFNDAREAARTAETAFRDGAKPDELLRRLRAAADAARRLADRLTGGESDLDRLRRLAGQRRTAADEAERLRKSPPNAGASAEAARQAGRELDELIHTRVGAAGQVFKRRVLDQYARLRELPAPERQAGAQKALAESLDELAALTADVAELTTPLDRTPAAPAVAAADFLPSKPLADALRDLARRHRTARDLIAELPRHLEHLTKPGRDLFAGVEREQRRLAAELADPKDPAAVAALTTADCLRDGLLGPARDAAGQCARRLRELARGGKTPEMFAGWAVRQEAILAEIEALRGEPGAAAARQVARADQLAAAASELSGVLEAAARAAGADEPAGKALADAGKAAADARGLLAEAARKAAGGETADAGARRAAAGAALRAAADRIAGAVPKTPDATPDAPGDALLRAEAAMRLALSHLGEKPDPDRARKAMRLAAAGLDEVAASLGR